MSLLIKEPFVSNNNLYLSLEPLLRLNDRLTVGFSTRSAGFSTGGYESLNMGLHVQDDNSTVIANREKLAVELAIPLTNWIFSEQVHGNTIQKVSSYDMGAGAYQLATAINETDGLYTNEKNVLLASLYADCVPLYFYSSVDHFVGLAHAGWKGTVGEIGPKMVNLWIEKEGIPPEAIYVAIGPCISKENYEVDDFVIERVNKVVNSHTHLPYKQIAPNKYLLDLKELNKQLLISAGIKEEHIFISRYCTYDENQLFYSYRREQQTGRMMSFICKG